uniref:Secreted protein n=1 Tax=Panagrellus redivivus TaxID=6233 RepID=A0A7E4UTI1_PANRE
MKRHDQKRQTIRALIGLLMIVWPRMEQLWKSLTEDNAPNVETIMKDDAKKQRQTSEIARIGVIKKWQPQPLGAVDRSVFMIAHVRHDSHHEARMDGADKLRQDVNITRLTSWLVRSLKNHTTTMP